MIPDVRVKSKILEIIFKNYTKNISFARKPDGVFKIFVLVAESKNL